MMKKRRVYSVLMAGAVMSVMMAGCGGGGGSADGGSSAGSEVKGSAGTDETVKVAEVCGGPITDKSWNETSYNGLCAIESMGAEISYMEGKTNSAGTMPFDAEVVCDIVEKRKQK